MEIPGKLPLEFRGSISFSELLYTESTPFKWLFPQPGDPQGQVVVLGVEVKATSHAS